jgi:hypothetical protein
MEETTMNKKIIKELASALNKTVDLRKTVKELRHIKWNLENELANFVNENMFMHDFTSEIELLRKAAKS